MSSLQELAQRTRPQRKAYARAWFVEHVLRALRLPSSLARPAAESRLAHHRALLEQVAHESPEPLPIDRRTDLSPEEFEREYLDTDTPVVLVGAAREWTCVQEWTPARFGRRFSEEPIRLLRSGPNEAPLPGTGELTTFGEVIDRMEAGGSPYIRFSSIINKHPELIDDFDEAWLVRMRCATRGYGNYGLFLGGKGTATGLHSAMAPNLFVQVHGLRQWFIYPACFAPFLLPPVHASPFFYSQVDARDIESCAKHLPAWKTTLEPGDVLFNPAFFWHQVQNLSPTIGVGYRWTSFKQALRVAPLQTMITLTATNPPVWTLRHQTDFPTVLDQHTH